MFWGLILEPQRRYSQVVQRSFHISKASLDIFAATDKPCQVMLTSQDRNYLLCTLQKDSELQCTLDLNFVEGEEVVFATNGGSNVHLTGYLMEEELGSEAEEEEDGATTEEDEFEEIAVGSKRKRQPQDSQPKKKTKTEVLLDEIDNDYNSEEDPTYPIDDLDLDSEEIEDDADEDDDDSDESEDDISNLSKEDVYVNGGSGKRQLRKAVQNLLSKAKQDSESESSEAEEEEKPTKQKSKLNGTPKVKNEKPLKVDKPAKKQKVAQESPKPEKSSNLNKSQDNKTPKKTRQIEGGVIVQDLKEGDGKAVKNGKVVQVYYEGRLKSNNKVFDSTSKGTGFKFRVGKKEVIKGWDVGLVGMKVGGKRRITCPPNMAYGPQGSGSVIPPNSTLIFDIEVKNVS